MSEIDVIDQLVGITPGSKLDEVRNLRPEARRHAQASYAALFASAALSGVSATERFALACYTIGLQGETETLSFYSANLVASGAAPELCAAVEDAVAQTVTTGPSGAYPPGPLTSEDTPGPDFTLDDATRTALGPRLAVAFAHAHMLVFHPRDAAPDSLGAMLTAGWSTTDIVTLSQIIAFLAFQIRVVAGFRVMARAA